MAVRYLSGSDEMEAGGDWYDVFELSGGRLGVAVGDVVGRGLQAATVMGQLRTALRAIALLVASPGRVVERLSKIAENLAPDQMATLIYGIIDPQSRTFHFANAGHPPPLLKASHGESSYLEGGRCLPLGVGGSGDDDAVVSLEVGSTLMLYTDGLVERRHTPIDDGMSVLSSLVSNYRGDLESLCEAVVDTLDARTAGDDVAVLALRLNSLVEHDLKMSMPLEPKLLSILRTTLGRWLADVGANDSDADDVVLAVSEAVSNAMVHAHGLEDGLIDLEGDHHDGEVVITVRDYGRWRDLEQGLGGRGMLIMRSVMDEVDVDSNEAGTRVRLRRLLGRQPRALESLPARLEPDILYGGADAVRRVAIVPIKDDVDLSTAAEVAAQLGKAVSTSDWGVVVDLTECGYLDSAGLRLLFDATRKLRLRRQALHIAIPDGSPLLRSVMLTGLDSVAPRSPSVEAAVESLVQEHNSRSKP